MSFGPLVEPGWLRDHLDDPGLAVVDCRFVLGDPGAGERAWREGHIPGAAVLDVDRDLSDRPGRSGRHPLPPPDRFEAAARRAGIGAEDAGGGLRRGGRGRSRPPLVAAAPLRSRRGRRP